MYLGKPEHLVKQTGVFTTAERSAVVDSIMQYRAQAKDKHWGSHELLPVETQLSSGCQSAHECGHFSFVIAHPTDQGKIIKVQIKPSDVYPLYVNAVLNAEVQEYAPTFFVTGQILGHNVYIMERVQALADVYENVYIEEQLELLEDMRGMSTAEVQNLMQKYQRWRKPIAYAYSYIRKALQELVVRTDSFFDMHAHNWGVRKDGTIVCLDPIA